MDKIRNGDAAMNGITSITVQERSKVPTWHATWVASLAAICGLWQYGYAVGTINAIYFPLTEAIKMNCQERYGTIIRPGVVNVIWVVISGAFPFGGIIGSFLVNPIARKFGSLRGMVYGHIAVILLSAILGISGPIKSPEAIILGRIGIGITSASIGTGLTVMYVAEVSPQRYRGFFGTLVSAAIAVGLVASNILGLPQVLGNARLWPALLVITCLPSVFFVAFSKLMPESPRELYIRNKNKETAIKVLRKLRGVQDVASEITEMEEEVQRVNSTRQLTVLQLIRSRELRHPLLSAFIIAGGQQMLGINSVAFNLNDIYNRAGIPQDATYYWSIGFAATQFVFNFFASFFIDKYGRKRLMMIGYTLVACSHALLVISIETHHLADFMSYVSVAASLTFITGFAVGPGPVTFVMVAEFFDQSARSAAVTLSSVILWICMTIMVLATPYLLASISGYTFFLEGIFALLTLLWIYFYVPETKNRPFCEIQESFSTARYALNLRRFRNASVPSTSPHRAI